MILANSMIMDENFRLRHCDLRIERGRIAEIGEHLLGDEIVDMSDRYILPGFIDTHIHGACGCRFDDDNSDFERITEFEASKGVTSVAATTSTTEFNKLLKQLEAISKAVNRNKGAKIAGIHAEGPFLSEERKGAMDPKYIILPDIEKLDAMIKSSGGLLKIITVAPESEGALSFIRHAVTRGLTVSMGHTNATFDQAQEAIWAGVTRATHTFNAMRAFNHREPGVLGAALTDPAVCCEMICDFVHLHPATVKMIYSLKGVDNINVISDSVIAAGMTVTEFECEGEKRYIKDGVVWQPNGTIDGSAKTLLDGVKNLASLGIPLSDISKMVSLNPAKALGIAHKTGSIAVGKAADLAVLDKNYDVQSTYVEGECVYRKE